MKRFQPALVALLVGLAPAGDARAGFDDYPVKSVAAVLDERAPRPDDIHLQKPGDLYLELGPANARSRVVCSGQTRALSAERLAFLARYFAARQQPGLASLFAEEAQCSEGTTEYWFPVQVPVMAYFKKEVLPASEVDVYLLYVGSFRSADHELTPVIVCNEFRVAKAGDH